MWPFKKRVRQRRLEVRKNIPTQQGLWRRFVQAGGRGSAAIAFGFFAAVAALMIFPAQPHPYRLGQVLPKQYARVAFEVPNTVQTKEARDEADELTPRVYRFNKALQTEVQVTLNSLPAMLKDVTGLEEIPPQLSEQLDLVGAEDLTALQELFPDEDSVTRWHLGVQEVSAELMRMKYTILSKADFESERRQQTVRIVLLAPDKEEERDSWKAIMATNDPAVSGELDAVVQPLPLSVRQRVRDFLARLIGSGKATYLLDPARTAEVKTAARAAVPIHTTLYQADSVIFDGDKLTPADLPILLAEHAAYTKWRAADDPDHDVRVAAGQVIMALLVVMAMAGYVARYQQRIVQNHAHGLALAGLLLLMLGMTKIMISVAGWNLYLAVGPAVMGAIIIAIAYDQRFALAIGSLLAVLLAMLLKQDVGLLLTLMAPVVVSILLLKEIRTRSKLIEVGALAAVAALLTTAFTHLARDAAVNGRLMADSGWAALAVIASGFIIQGTLPLIERLFPIATSMTLLEWCDANKKLLKRLAMEAPGTYNHSLLLGTLCEAAADAIGARGLLARVGAYYHDIGKINKPEYFVENQFDSPSKHSKLSPAMSLLIITGHVKDGIEMAKEYGLPRVLHEFIATHHGTTLVQYFYHSATMQRKGNETDRAPEEVEFRYPGPKPLSKETAILMLADATESSTRAMTDPTPGRIEAQAHAMVTARLMDGQLDECELTLRQVHQIEESLIKSLCGIYHGRIAYPKTEDKTPSARTGHAGA